MQISVWEKETYFAPQDIIVVGSGLLGLWSALELKTKYPALKITILERSCVPSGASTRNAGFACFGSPSELINDKEKIGSSNMWMLVEMRFKGIQKIKKHFTSAIDYDQCGGYEVYNKKISDLELIADRIDWLNKGLKSITGNGKCFQWVNEQLALFGFSGFDGMITNPLEGTLHSGKLVQALLQKVQSLGVQVFTNIKVEQWDCSNGTITINPHLPLSFSARQMLLCTNAFTRELLPELDVSPGRGQIILTSPIPGLSMKGAFHYQEGYYYFRELNNRILLGGARNIAFEEEETTAMGTSQLVQDQLENFTREHLLPGRSFTIEQKWSGIMSFTSNKQPLVRRLDDHVAVALACNGMGVALAPIIAENVCEMMA